jgi:hypothetical protein
VADIGQRRGLSEGDIARHETCAQGRASARDYIGLGCKEKAVVVSVQRNVRASWAWPRLVEVPQSSVYVVLGAVE